MNVENAGSFLSVLACIIRTTRTALTLFLPICIALLIGGGNAYSAAGPGDPPVYNPASGSYFQILVQTTQKKKWSNARRLAASRTYKGVRGRLALVGSSETHEFILRTFDMSKPTWIGLRYWCRYRMLEWSGERPYSPSDPGHFKAWHSQWIRNKSNYCSAHWPAQEAYMAVYYQPLGGSNARWQAAAPPKFFQRVLVEFPTGEE